MTRVVPIRQNQRLLLNLKSYGLVSRINLINLCLLANYRHLFSNHTGVIKVKTPKNRKLLRIDNLLMIIMT